MGWNDLLTLLNTADTFLGLFIILLMAERGVVWFRRVKKFLRGRDKNGPK